MLNYSFKYIQNMDFKCILIVILTFAVLLFLSGSMLLTSCTLYTLWLSLVLYIQRGLVLQRPLRPQTQNPQGPH